MRCKVGDLALVLQSISGDNIGRIVRVVQKAVIGTNQLPEKGTMRLAESDWVVTSASSRLLTCRGRKQAHIGKKDCHLLPLRPDYDEKTKENEELAL